MTPSENELVLSLRNTMLARVLAMARDVEDLQHRLAAVATCLVDIGREDQIDDPKEGGHP